MVNQAAAALVMAVGVGAMLASPARAQEPCNDCVAAWFWEVATDVWDTETGPEFPETTRLVEERPYDFGVAFSGGGTRSAAAAIGQLRGLQKNGWLDRVRYMTAASGGSWTVIPYIYSREPLDDLLGPYVASGHLSETGITVPSGQLAERIEDSGLLQYGLQEVPQFLPDELADRDIRRWRSGISTLRDVIRRVRRRGLPDSNRQNKAYTHTLGQVFLQGLISDGNRRPYTWDTRSAADLSAMTGQPISRFTQAPDDRPFWIVGGTLVWQHPALDYPRLIPVEYTPLYTGIRQQFGGLGGSYVSPWAYDRLMTAPRTEETIWVAPGPGSDDRVMTLADVMASSGAAPQLQLLLADRLPERLREPLARAAGAFPAFTTTTVRQGSPRPPGEELPHGDGGFTDNLALMPLLARQVRNILVFVNSNKNWRENAQLQSYFMRLDVRDGSGDKSMNAVFDQTRFIRVIQGLEEATRAGGAAVFCGSNWDVAANELYNIHAYGGLNICWIYNHAATRWRTSLPPTIQAWLSGERETDESKALRNFPYYATFGQNLPTVIRLNALQINLLADLTAWSVTHDRAVSQIRGALSPDLLPGPPLNETSSILGP